MEPKWNVKWLVINSYCSDFTVLMEPKWNVKMSLDAAICMRWQY